MDLTELTTPSGHKVFINPIITYGIRRQLQRVFLASAEVDNEKQKANFNGASLYDAQDLAVKLLVVKIVEVSGREFNGGQECFNVISSWTNKEDGDAVYRRINELTEIIPEDKKKLS